jgi:hypothetical protein
LAAAGKGSIRQPVAPDPRLRGNSGEWRRPLEANQIDLATRRRQRRGVVLHARAAAQISEYDNGGSH